jgi:hypothetical protein
VLNQRPRVRVTDDTESCHQRDALDRHLAEPVELVAADG